MDRKRLMPLVILQFVPLLIMPPTLLASAGAITLVVAVLVIYALLGWGLLRGRSWALTMSIFLQGLNVIIRLMMLFPNAVSRQGVWDIPLIISFLIAIVLSGWFLVRLDRPDVRSTIVD